MEAKHAICPNVLKNKFNFTSAAITSKRSSCLLCLTKMLSQEDIMTIHKSLDKNYLQPCICMLLVLHPNCFPVWLAVSCLTVPRELMIAFILILFIRQLWDKQKKGFGIVLMEVHIQEGSNSSIEQPDNFNDVGWASFPEINEKEPVRRVSHC